MPVWLEPHSITIPYHTIPYLLFTPSPRPSSEKRFHGYGKMLSAATASTINEYELGNRGSPGWRENRKRNRYKCVSNMKGGPWTRETFGWVE